MAIICQALDYYGYFVGSKSFVSDQFDDDLVVGLAGAFLDRTLNSVAIDRGLAGFLDGGRKARVRIRVAAAEFGGHHDLAHQLVDQLAFLLRIGFAARLFPLCAHSPSSLCAAQAAFKSLRVGVLEIED